MDNRFNRLYFNTPEEALKVLPQLMEQYKDVRFSKHAVSKRVVFYNIEYRFPIDE